MNSLHMPASQRGHTFKDKRQAPSVSPQLPPYSTTFSHEKHAARARFSKVFTTFFVSIPGVRGRLLKIYLPNPYKLYHWSVSRFGRRRGGAVLSGGLLAVIWVVFVLIRWIVTPQPTLVFTQNDLRRIWEWEIKSGHYPSYRPVPEQIGLTREPINPALPVVEKTMLGSLQNQTPLKSIVQSTKGIGLTRAYLDIHPSPPNISYPTRPAPGSVADLDVVMDHCDFSNQKYVRDCLEFLRIGAGLNNEKRFRRADMNERKYIYLEQKTAASASNTYPNRGIAQITRPQLESNKALSKKWGIEWEPPIHLPQTLDYLHYDMSHPCDSFHPRIYHMFWTGPFTDKPYIALLSFLYTQNLGLHSSEDDWQLSVCRPQLWLWINTGPAAAAPNPTARRDMFAELKSNPWASPFLHPRFKQSIKFKLWNTTEQLDGIPELKHEWRALKRNLFNTGGRVVKVPSEYNEAKKEVGMTSEDGFVDNMSTPQAPYAGTTANDDPLYRLGSKSSSSYDKLSVILSDMARFILCHRFGGIYLDVDTVLLRDWEELWGWKGAFAYRWSRLPRYNTAVLRMNKGSALGTFLFKTALKNGLDFHPMTVARYTKDAYLEGLLLRLPDALFDPAWLNTEKYQRDRPPQPYFTAFEDFFDTPLQNSAAPQALGMDGFFKGAYSYHYHNFFWKPLDPSRNWPDLGPRFAKGERQARLQLQNASDASKGTDADLELEWQDKVFNDKRDLDWATVLKRTFESYVRGESPNMYGEWIQW